MKMTKNTVMRVLAAALTAVALAPLSACGGSGGANVTTLSFFQTKPEAVEDYTKIIADFERLHPNIKVVQNQVSSADTALRALLVKDRTPDVIALNPNGSMGKMAKAGVFYDFSNTPISHRIRPVMQSVINGLGRDGKQINIVPYAGNVCGITYNVDLFKQHGIKVPKTWKDLEQAVATLEADGVAPFIGTLGDPNRVSTPFDGLAPYYDNNGFWDKMRAEGKKVGPDSPVSFQKNFKPLMERLYWIYQHSTKDVRTMTYEDGTSAFARGEGAMLLAGNWSMAPVLQINPKMHIGFFPYPTDEADKAILVSGGDVAITMGAHPKHERESMAFINYLYSDEVQRRFVKSQQLIPSLSSIPVDENPAMKPAKYWIDSGRIQGYADHQIPSSISYNPILNKAMLDGDLDSALTTLDKEWGKVAARTIE